MAYQATDLIDDDYMFRIILDGMMGTLADYRFKKYYLNKVKGLLSRRFLAGDTNA